MSAYIAANVAISRKILIKMVEVKLFRYVTHVKCMETAVKSSQITNHAYSYALQSSVP